MIQKTSRISPSEREPVTRTQVEVPKNKFVSSQLAGLAIKKTFGESTSSMKTHREKCLKRQTSDPTQGKLKYAKSPKIADPKHTQGLNDAARLVYEDNFLITSVASSAVLLTVLTSLPILQVTAIPITKPSFHSGFDPITDPIIAFVTNPNYQLIYRQPNYNYWLTNLLVSLDRNNSDRNFYNVVRYVHIPLVP